MSVCSILDVNRFLENHSMLTKSISNNLKHKQQEQEQAEKLIHQHQHEIHISPCNDRHRAGILQPSRVGGNPRTEMEHFR